jgi:RNA polymerase sigma-70 factor (ECF subfamily)
MGRHAANRPAPDSSSGSSSRPLLHSDLIVPPRARGAEEEHHAAVFDALVGPHSAALHAYVLRLTDGDEGAAESVIKETLYRAAQDPERYPERPTAVRPWLVLLARKVLRDGERLAPAGHDDRPLPGPHSSVRRARPATTVARALDELSPVHRDVLVELFYRGVSLEEAAEVRGVPVETVKSRLYYAMRALRVVLDQQVAGRAEAE